MLVMCAHVEKKQKIDGLHKVGRPPRKQACKQASPVFCKDDDDDRRDDSLVDFRWHGRKRFQTAYAEKCSVDKGREKEKQKKG